MPAPSSAIGPPAVRCRRLVREFGEREHRVQVLQGVELDVPVGEITFVTGPSGCGKTTLISAITGILSLHGGEVEVFGIRVDRLRGGELTDWRARTTGLIFQQFNLLPALSAVENAMVPLLIRKVPWHQARARAAVLLERLGLGPHRDRLPGALSGGQQQRVAVARALVHEPRLVVCDEPTAMLDAVAGQGVMRLLREVALDAGRAVLVVTHDDRILGFADRICQMSNGRIEPARPWAAVA